MTRNKRALEKDSSSEPAKRHHADVAANVGGDASDLSIRMPSEQPPERTSTQPLSPESSSTETAKNGDDLQITSPHADSEQADPAQAGTEQATEPQVASAHDAHAQAGTEQAVAPQTCTELNNPLNELLPR
ncbi:hypothetical protein EIP86_007271 [Pleurotus ostreatoroseus]|nr:hypothetical protein EIP86_007271 [Pleurotus ostreatoroseus]